MVFPAARRNLAGEILARKNRSAAGRCWYECDRRCRSPNACKIAGYCCSAFNPAESEAVRRGMGGVMWVWAVHL